MDAEKKNEECVIEEQEEEEVEEDEADMIDEREEVEGGGMGGKSVVREVMEREGVVGVEVMETPVVLDESVKKEVETMVTEEEEEEEVSDAEGVKEEVETAGGQPTGQVVKPLVLCSSSPWTRSTGHNQLNELVMNKEVEVTGRQPTGQVVWPPFLGFSIWSMPAEHSQSDWKKGEEEEEMTEEDLEVARIMSNLPPIVPTIREQPRSWLYEYDSYYSLF